MEQEARQYAEAKVIFDTCGILREQIEREKAEAYGVERQSHWLRRFLYQTEPPALPGALR